METKKIQKKAAGKRKTAKEEENLNIINKIVPVQQIKVNKKPGKKVVEEAVKELTPDQNSMSSRG